VSQPRLKCKRNKEYGDCSKHPCMAAGALKRQLVDLGPSDIN